MLNLLRKSLSGEKKDEDTNEVKDTDTSATDTDGMNSSCGSPDQPDQRSGKRFRSGSDDSSINRSTKTKSNKRKKKLMRENPVVVDDGVSQVESMESFASKLDTLLPGTPSWCLKFLEIMQGELRAINQSISKLDCDSNTSTTSIKIIEQKIETVE